jgi:hypothetical protein
MTLICRQALIAGAIFWGMCGVAEAGGTGSSAMPYFDLSRAIVDVPDLGALDGIHSSDSAIAAIIEPAGGGPSRFAENWFGRIVVPHQGPYGLGTFWDQAKTIPLEISAVVALPLYHGLDHWNWGKSSFHFHSEGWFGKNTKYAGIDKLGHAYTTYLYSDFFTQRIAHKTGNPTGAALTGSLIAFGIMAGVEVGDGFSPDYGFSPEDLIADGVGAGFGFLRNTIPGLADKLDYRMEYVKSSRHSFDPVSDYEGQKYILALKLGGFERFEDSPLRFFELHGGYFVRHDRNASGTGYTRRREPYVGIGLNLQQLLAETPANNTSFGLAADRFFEYYQPPYTYIATQQN